MIAFQSLGLICVVTVVLAFSTSRERPNEWPEDSVGSMFEEYSDTDEMRTDTEDFDEFSSKTQEASNLETREEISSEKWKTSDLETIEGFSPETWEASDHGTKGQFNSETWEASSLETLDESEQLGSDTGFDKFSEEETEQQDTENEFDFVSSDSKDLEMAASGMSVPARFHGKTLRVTNGGPWGDWGEIQYCKTGAYATGYDIKIQPYQGAGEDEDDTALNAIKLICEYPKDWAWWRNLMQNGGRPTSSQGPWGSWEGQSSCMPGYFLTKFKLQVERPQGYHADDTSANFVKFMCRDLKGSDETELPNYLGSGELGSYGDWSEGCPEGEAICGIQTKVQGSCGEQCDDTALNDVNFYCCG